MPGPSHRIKGSVKGEDIQSHLLVGVKVNVTRDRLVGVGSAAVDFAGGERAWAQLRVLHGRWGLSRQGGVSGREIRANTRGRGSGQTDLTGLWLKAGQGGGRASQPLGAGEAELGQMQTAGGFLLKLTQPGFAKTRFYEEGHRWPRRRVSSPAKVRSSRDALSVDAVSPSCHCRYRPWSPGRACVRRVPIP